MNDRHWLRFQPDGGRGRGIWPLPSITETLPADPKDRVGFSEYGAGGPVVFQDVIKFYYDQSNKMFGTDYQPPTHK